MANFDKDPFLEMNSPVVTHNLRMMSRDMEDVWSDAPTVDNPFIKGRTYNIAYLSGYADRENGEISAFIGESQHVPKEIRDKSVEFTFVGGHYFDIKKRREAREILEFHGADDFSELGRKHIKEAIKAYNDSH